MFDHFQSKHRTVQQTNRSTKKENKAKMSSSPSSRRKNQNQLREIFIEFGLDPNDFVFNSSEKPNQSQQIPPPPRPFIRGRNRQQMSGQTTPTKRAPPPIPDQIADELSFKPRRDDEILSAEEYLAKLQTASQPPVKVVKPNSEELCYRKEIRIRYLQPPTPPPPAPIIIREKQLPPPPAPSPILIREKKDEARTPPPLTIRERPPTPPPLLEPHVIEKTIPAPAAPPRQIIIERLPTPPPKPRTVIFEKWLPYKKVRRPVLLERAQPLPPVEPPRNVIIEYEPLKAYTVRRIIEEGVFRVDPREYEQYHHQTEGDVRIVDRIDDLPPPSEELLRVLNEYRQSQHFDSTEDLSKILQNQKLQENSNFQSSTNVSRQDQNSSSVIHSIHSTPTTPLRRY